MRRLQIFMLVAVLALILPCSAFATSLWFDPGAQYYDYGDTLTLDLMADIDQNDAIFGYSFDLSFDGGATYINNVGDSGTYLTFAGFSPNSAYFWGPSLFWDDGDTISAEVPIFDPDVYGSDILLGTFSFTAPLSGPLGMETFYLGPAAGDYGIYGLEGLLGSTAFMPNNPTATASPVPEPATLFLLGAGLAGLAGARRKRNAGRLG